MGTRFGKQRRRIKDIVCDLLFIIFIIFLLYILLPSCSPHNYSGLVSWEEYQRRRNFEPYVLELDGDTGSLLYFGVLHTQHANSPQIHEIKKRWREFRPDVVFTEGGIWPLEISLKTAVEKHGEQGLVRYLCRRDGIIIKSLEPRREQETFLLLKHFSAEQIKVFYILRQALLQRIMGREINDIRYVHRILKRLSAGPFAKTKLNTIRHFELCVSHMFPGLENWRLIPESYFYSSEPGSWLSRMFRMVNDIRNHSMIRKIMKQVKRGKRVFAVAGRSHVVMQEPVLRAETRQLR